MIKEVLEKSRVCHPERSEGSIRLLKKGFFVILNEVKDLELI
jgi:hypothetical protein